MVAVSSSESSFGSFFPADWYSPMDLIRTLSSLACQDAAVTDEQIHLGDQCAPDCCVQRMGAPSERILHERENLREQATQELYASVVAELNDEEKSLKELLEGPAGIQLSDEQALRQKVKLTLLDASSTGSLQLALAAVDQSRSHGTVLSAQSATPEALPQDDNVDASWEKLGQSLSAASDLLTLRGEYPETKAEILEAASNALRVESEIPVEQPKATPDFEALRLTDMGSPHCEEVPQCSANTDQIDQLRLDVSPPTQSASALQAKKLAKARDALTKSKRPEATGAEQLDLQSKTALLDGSFLGHTQAKWSSPTKGKALRRTPQKGGS